MSTSNLVDPVEFRKKYGPWGLITGASAGIGAEFARQMAAIGLNLILVARRQDQLEALAAQLEKTYQIQTSVIVLDLSRPDFFERLTPKIRDLEIGLLVNNAGIGLLNPFLENEWDQEEAMFHLNTYAPLRVTHALGQKMTERRQGGIIFVSSTSAYQGVPFTANYAATKAYTLLLAEGLWYELKDYGVDVLALTPGLTNTDAARRLGLDPVAAGAMPTQAVVRNALQALGRQPYCMPGFRNRLRYLLGKHIFSRKRNIIKFGRMMHGVRSLTQKRRPTQMRR